MNDPVNENGKPSANSSSSPDSVRLNQKEEAKPCNRERSQGWSVMTSREVASPPGRMGSPLGQFCGRASVLRAKSVFLLWRGSQDAVCSVSGALAERVIHAITNDKRNIHSTDEILRRPGAPGQVISGYKPYAKGLRYASEMGTASSRPLLKGCQQRQSKDRPLNRPRPERQNLSVPVSAAVQATKWPDGTSSCQPALKLRNMPQQSDRLQQAVRQH